MNSVQAVRRQLKAFEKQFVADHGRPAKRTDLPETIGTRLRGWCLNRLHGQQHLPSRTQRGCVCGFAAASLYTRYAQLKQQDAHRPTPSSTDAAAARPTPTNYGFAADADKRTKRIPDDLVLFTQVHSQKDLLGGDGKRCLVLRRVAVYVLALSGWDAGVDWITQAQLQF